MDPLEPDWANETLEQTFTQQAQRQVLQLTLIHHAHGDRVGDWHEWPLPPITPSDPPPSPLAQFQLSRQEPIFRSAQQGPARDLADPYLSRRSLAFKVFVDGSVLFLRQQCPSPVLINQQELEQELRLSAAQLNHGIIITIAQRVVLQLKRREVSWPRQHYSGPDYGMVGHGDEMDQVRCAIQRLAPLDIPVLIRGESGTGKELVARALHQASSRFQGPFVAVNAAAIPTSLATAEIFGAVRGAFTGSHQTRRGYLSQAGKGTLFLDEIGDLPAEVQVMLLRVLETLEYQSLGSHENQTFNARLIAATDVDLEHAIQSDEFRSSLYHRLSATEVRLPALRNQIQNLGVLIRYFLQQEVAELGLDQSCLAIRPIQQASWLPALWIHRLCLAQWPGNIRQLRNAVRQLLLLGHRLEQLEQEPQLSTLVDQLCQAQAIKQQHSVHHQDPRSRNEKPPATAKSDPDTTTPKLNGAQRLRDMSDDDLLIELENYQWRLQKAAQELKVPRSSLYDRIHRSPLLNTALLKHRKP